MTKDTQHKEYKTDVRKIRIPGMFRSYLRAWGMAEKTVNGYVERVRACAGILGCGNPEESPDGWEDVVTEALPGLSERTIHNYILAWRHYARFSRIRRVTDDGRERYIMSESFLEDIRKYRDDVCAAYNEEEAKKDVRVVRNICFLIAENMGNLWPEEIGPETVEALEPCIEYGKVETARSYLRYFGRFISVVTGGPDPYRLWISPGIFEDAVTHVERIFSESRFSSELSLYARVLEENGMRRSTVETNPRRAAMCLKRLEDMGWEGELSEITPELIRYLRSTMTDVREETARGYLVCLGSLVELYTGKNPVTAANLRWNTDCVVQRKFIDMDDWRRLLSVANVEERLVLMLGGTMGLRRSEISWLTLDDVRDGYVVIQGKGHGPNGKLGILEINDAVAAALDDYLEFRKDLLERYGDRSGGRLMVNSAVHVGEPASPNRITDIIESLGDKAGVDLSTHSLRRFYATYLHNSGADVMSIKTLLRHKNLTTTDRYLKVCDDSLRSAVKRFQAAIFS